MLSASAVGSPRPIGDGVDPARSEDAEVDVTQALPVQVPEGLPPSLLLQAPASELPGLSGQREFSPATAHPAQRPLASSVDVVPAVPDDALPPRTGAQPLLSPTGRTVAMNGPTSALDGPLMPDASPRSILAHRHPPTVAVGAPAQPGNADTQGGRAVQPPVPAMHAGSVTTRPATDPEPVRPVTDMTVGAYMRTNKPAARLATPLVPDGASRDRGTAPPLAKGSPRPATGPVVNSVAADTPVTIVTEPTAGTGADAVAMPGTGAIPPGTAALATSSVLGAAIPMTALPQALATALQDDPARQVELRLDPPELGSVRFQLDQRNADLVVTIIAERPETLDLMRRHADQLLADLRQAGFQGASLSFGTSPGQGGSGHGGSGQGAGHASGQDGPVSPAPSPSFVLPASPPPRAATGGLNLRL
jgi:Flagellar hook-length control protein FliK